MEIILLETNDIPDSFLQDFNRYQRTTTVCVMESENVAVKQDEFIDDWDEQKKLQIAANLRKTVVTGGAVICARQHGKLLGFSVIEPERFGTEDVYLELSYIHISADYRGKGIGEKLFSKTLQEAKKMGATKLYIGAHPAIETQSFYKKMGCVPAKEVNPIIHEREPRDLQLEVKV